jgi:ribosome-binding protein aMBF1 (putative translation factor)
MTCHLCPATIEGEPKTLYLRRKPISVCHRCYNDQIGKEHKRKFAAANHREPTQEEIDNDNRADYFDSVMPHGL